MFKIEIMMLALSENFHTQYKVRIACPLYSTESVYSDCTLAPHTNRVEANKNLVAMLVAAAEYAERVFELTDEESAKLTSEMLQFITLRIPPITAGYGD